MPVERTPFVMVMPENDNFVSQGVTLVLNNGEEIDLNRENGDVLVQRLPQVIQSITADSLNGLVYSPGQPVPELEGTHTLKVPRGGEYFVVLDDGTKVWLNAETEFRYPVVFGEKERVVELSGEAYFQVHRDEKRPFIVKTAGCEHGYWERNSTFRRIQVGKKMLHSSMEAWRSRLPGEGKKWC